MRLKKIIKIIYVPNNQCQRSDGLTAEFQHKFREELSNCSQNRKRVYEPADIEDSYKMLTSGNETAGARIRADVVTCITPVQDHQAN